MANLKENNLRWLWISIVVITIDQITKQWVSHHFSLYETYPLLSFFNLTYAQNKGAAFSFLSQSGEFSRWFLSIIAWVVTVFMSVWLYRLPKEKTLLSIAIALIIGGALGNVADRITHGYVIDFLDFFIQNWHWPAFNIADSAITLGAFLLVLDFFKNKE